MKATIRAKSISVEVSGDLPRGACGKQLGFIHAREPDAPGVAGPGARAFARSQADRVIESASEPESPIKHEALERVRDELARYLSRLGVGTEFQAVDFLNDLDRRGLRPSPEVLDMRCTGGLFRQLIAQGVISEVGYRSNGGGKATQYNSTRRPVYRVERYWSPDSCGGGSVE